MQRPVARDIVEGFCVTDYEECWWHDLGVCRKLTQRKRIAVEGGSNVGVVDVTKYIYGGAAAPR